MPTIDYEAVEAQARQLQTDIWDRQASLWPGRTLHPLDMFTPETAAHVLGLKLSYGELVAPGRRDLGVEVAGYLDRPQKLVAVSDRSSRAEQRFTAMHEIAHWLLHPDLRMHRERPMKGMVAPHEYRPLEEREADYFAACFLVPRNTARKEFEFRFGTRKLVLDDTSAFWLSKGNPDDLLTSDADSLDFPMAAARACSYGGKQFDSLTKLFDVSTTTMAIRLKELGLVERRWP